MSPIFKGRPEREKIDNAQTKMVLLEGQETRANTNDKLFPAEGSKVAHEPLEGRPLVKISSRLPLPT